MGIIGNNLLHKMNIQDDNQKDVAGRRVWPLIESAHLALQDQIAGLRREVERLIPAPSAEPSPMLGAIPPLWTTPAAAAKIEYTQVKAALPQGSKIPDWRTQMKNMTDTNSSGTRDTSMGTGSVNYEKSAYGKGDAPTSPDQTNNATIAKDSGASTIDTYNAMGVNK